MKIKNSFLEKIKEKIELKNNNKIEKNQFPEERIFDFQTESKKEDNYLQNSSNNPWKELEVKEKKFLGFLWRTGKKEIETKTGQTLTIENLNMDNLIARENIETGEVILLNDEGFVDQLIEPKPIVNVLTKVGLKVAEAITNSINPFSAVMQNFNEKDIEKLKKNGIYERIQEYIKNANEEDLEATKNLFSNKNFCDYITYYDDYTEFDKILNLSKDEKNKTAILFNNTVFNVLLKKNSTDSICKLAKLDEKNFNNAINNFNNPSLLAMLDEIEPMIYEDILSEIGKSQNLNSLSNEELKDYLISLSNYTGICGSKNFDKFNKILHGEPVDKTLVEELNEIGEKYGIEIKSENNIALDPNNKNAEVYITKENLEDIEKALSNMQKRNMELPSQIYISDIEGEAGGFFNPTNPTAITLDANSLNIYDPEIVLPHETAHLKDYRGNEISKSTKKAMELGLAKTPLLYDEPIEKINFNGFEITKEEINGIIRDYASSDIVEFVAEIEALISYGTIIKNKNGEYTIDKNNIPDLYCKEWTGSEKDIQSLNNIMIFYEYLIA